MNLVSTQKSKAQDISELFIMPSYAVDISVLEYRNENTNDIFIGGFHQLGLEVGKKFGKRQIGLNLKYGVNPFYDRYLPDFIASYQTYWGVSVNYRAQLSPKNIHVNQFLKFGYRISAIYHNYNGSKVVAKMQGGSERVDAAEKIYGIESGLYFSLGKDNESKSNLLINLEPVYLRVTNNFYGVGFLRTGMLIRF